MRKSALAQTVLLVTALSLRAGAQTGSEAAAGGSISSEVPLYRVSFERRDTIQGIAASSAVKLPFECTDDGTVFLSFVSTVAAGSGLPAPPPVPPPLRLVSVSPAGKGQTFELGQISDLYISREVDHYVSESEVIFLVSAAREYKPEKRTYAMKSGGQGELSINAAKQHRYVLVFSRDGKYQRTIEIEDQFHIQELGVFASGVFLAFGYDEKDNSPKLAMLKEDGTLLKPLQIPKGDAPESMIGKADGPRPGVMAVVQLVPEDRSILIVQNDSTFPLLEVSEGGAVKVIHPRLPRDSRIKAVIPSDWNLYATIGQPSADPASEGTIYELQREDGKALRRFELSDARTPADIACIHDQKFLSFDYGDGKIVPLIGSVEPANAADQKREPKK